MRRAPLPELVAYLYDSTLSTKLTVTSHLDPYKIEQGQVLFSADNETVLENVSRGLLWKGV